MLELFFDGSCEPVNPGGTARYGYIIRENDEIIATGHGKIGEGEGMTCNVAEYEALLRGIERIKDSFDYYDGVSIYGDSRLVIEHINGNWGKKNPHKKALHLKAYLDKIMSLLKDINFEASWIPREENQEADYMSKMV